MSKSKSRRPSQRTSPTTKSSVKITSEAQETVKLASDAQETIELVEDRQEIGSDKASPSGKLTTSTSAKAASSNGKQSSTANAKTRSVSANGVKERPGATAGKRPPAPTPLPSVHRPVTKDAAKYARRQAERQSRFLAQRRAKRVRTTIISIAVLVILLGGAGGFLLYKSLTGTAQAAQPFQEAVFDSDFPPTQNIYCDQLEGSVEHIHAHLSIYINGQLSPLPAGVGIAANQQSQQATCFYWLHTHDTTGVIHIEAPITQPFTLGQFFAVWNQQFNSLGFPNELTLTSGWTIWVNGKVYNGSLDSVPLNAHALITIAYNSPKAKPDKTYNWGSL